MPPLSRSRVPVHVVTAIAAVLALLLSAFLFATFDATFRDYSARFGSLTEAEFAALNARMDRLRVLGKLVVLGLFFPLAVATCVLGLRDWMRTRRALPLVLGVVAALMALAAALLLAAAAAMPAGGMIG